MASVPEIVVQGSRALMSWRGLLLVVIALAPSQLGPSKIGESTGVRASGELRSLGPCGKRGHHGAHLRQPRGERFAIG